MKAFLLRQLKHLFDGTPDTPFRADRVFHLRDLLMRLPDGRFDTSEWFRRPSGMVALEPQTVGHAWEQGCSANVLGLVLIEFAPKTNRLHDDLIQISAELLGITETQAKQIASGWSRAYRTDGRRSASRSQAITMLSKLGYTGVVCWPASQVAQ